MSVRGELKKTRELEKKSERNVSESETVTWDPHEQDEMYFYSSKPKTAE